jgi:hypothetical protein
VEHLGPDGGGDGNGHEVLIPVPGGDHVLVDVRHRREAIVRRLLCLGVSTRTLRALLPEWTLLIASVADSYALDASGRIVGAPLDQRVG